MPDDEFSFPLARPAGTAHLPDVALTAADIAGIAMPRADTDTIPPAGAMTERESASPAAPTRQGPSLLLVLWCASSVLGCIWLALYRWLP